MLRILRLVLGVIVLLACLGCDSTVPLPPPATAIVVPTTTPNPRMAPPYAQIHTIVQRIWNDALPRAEKLTRLQTYAAALDGKRLAGWQGWVIAVQPASAVAAYADLYLADPYGEGRDQVQYWSAADNKQDRSHEAGELWLQGLSPAALRLLTIGEVVQVDGLLTRTSLENGMGFTVENPVLTAVPDPPMTADAPADLLNTLMTVRQTSCMGPCPDHEILIHGDGSVVYESLDSNKKVTGRKTATLPPAQVAVLVRLFDRVNYTGLRPDYTNYAHCVVGPEGGPIVMASDQPTFRTSLTRNGQTTAVEHYTGLSCAPVKLRILENRLNELADTVAWTP